MRVLVAGYWVEGPTDSFLIMPIVERALSDWLYENANAPVDVLMNELKPPRGVRTFVERAVSLVADGREWLDVLFVHTDAGSTTQDRAWMERIEPLLTQVELEHPGWRAKVIPIIPIRESEAWLLASGDAIRTAAGLRASDIDLHLPRRVRDIERLGDPKKTLERALQIAAGQKLSADEKAVMCLGIARTISLQRLRSLSSYRAFEKALGVCLRQVSWLAGR